MTYCHFDDQGHIVTDTDFLNQHFATGVGHYDAGWSKIEAEWFYEKANFISKHSSIDGGFELRGMSDGSWVRFANVDMTKAGTKFTARVAGLSKFSNLEIRLDGTRGQL